MRSLYKGMLSLGLVVGLTMSITAAHAAIVNTGGPSCRPFGTTGFGDLDFVSNGSVALKSTAASKTIVCTLPRNFTSTVGSNNVMFFVDGSNANGQHVNPVLIVTSSSGTILGSFPPDGGALAFGNGNFDMPFTIPRATVSSFAVVSALISMPGSHNGSILGFATP